MNNRIVKPGDIYIHNSSQDTLKVTKVTSSIVYYTYNEFGNSKRRNISYNGVGSFSNMMGYYWSLKYKKPLGINRYL